MSRITIINLAGVAALSQNEMAATEGGLLFPPRRDWLDGSDAYLRTGVDDLFRG